MRAVGAAACRGHVEGPADVDGARVVGGVLGSMGGGSWEGRFGGWGHKAHSPQHSSWGFPVCVVAPGLKASMSTLVGDVFNNSDFDFTPYRLHYH